MELHPDKYSGDEKAVTLARELSGRVNGAYEVLRDPLKRAEYLVRSPPLILPIHRENGKERKLMVAINTETRDGRDRITYRPHAPSWDSGSKGRTRNGRITRGSGRVTSDESGESRWDNSGSQSGFLGGSSQVPGSKRIGCSAQVLARAGECREGVVAKVAAMDNGSDFEGDVLTIINSNQYAYVTSIVQRYRSNAMRCIMIV
jgi:curved DNA-binding protein CbpA